MPDFSAMTPFQIFIQLVGFVGTALTFISYQRKKRKSILLFQAAASTFFAAHFILLGAATGCVMNVLGALRAVIYSSEKKWIRSKAVPAVFLVLFAAVGAVTWESPKSLLPIAAMLLSTVSLWLKSPTQVRLVTLPTSPCWLVYNLLSGSYSGVITEILIMVSIISAIIRLDIIGRRIKK